MITIHYFQIAVIIYQCQFVCVIIAAAKLPSPSHHTHVLHQSTVVSFHNISFRNNISGRGDRLPMSKLRYLHHDLSWDAGNQD